MRILAVETSGARGGIALAEDARLLEEVRLDEHLRHARDLVAAIHEACQRFGWDRRRIDVAAVSIGPGSFTGVRIALTVAKFLAWDTGTKVVAVPSLRVLAENAPADRPRVVPVLDAKRGGLFADVFERHAGRLESLLGPTLIEPEALARSLERPAYVLGHGVPKAHDALGGCEFAPKDLWDLRPAVVVRLGFELAQRGLYVDPLRLEPVYLRPPEAEEIWERRRRAAGAGEPPGGPRPAGE